MISLQAGIYDGSDRSRKDCGKEAACDSGEDCAEKLMQTTERRGMKCEAPVFKAPIADLSSDAVSALPINWETVIGKDIAYKFLEQVKARNSEMCPPRASETTLKMLMSRWLQLEPGSCTSRTYDECSSAVECASAWRG